MNRFLLRLAVFSSVVLFLLIGLEVYSRIRSENHLLAKQSMLDEYKSDIEVLIVGNSHIRNGLDPTQMEKKALNMAFGGSEIFYDWSIVEENLEHLPNCKQLILGVSYHTLPGNLDDEGKLGKRYELYHYTGFNYKLDLNSFDMRNHSVVYTIEPSGALDNVIKDLTSNNRGEIYKNKGYTPYNSIINEDILDLNAKLRISNHHKFMKKDKMDENLEYFRRIYELCKKNDVELFVVTPPVTSVYESLQKEEFRDFTKRIGELSIQKGFGYLNCRSMKNVYHNGLFKDSDHLNKDGARIFTKQVMDFMKNNPTIE